MDVLFHVKDLLLLAAEGGEASHAAGVPQKVVEVGYLWLIPFFPLLGFAINAALGHLIQRRFGKKYVSYIAVGAMTLSFLTGVAAWIQMIGLPGSERYLVNFLWNLFTAGDVQANLSFALDPLSMMMVLIITFVGSLIHIYSIGYMADDPAYWRFFCYLNLFVFSMLLLVMGDNLVLMFFGWEGVGLCSYLLIGFWYEDIEKAKAAVKAFVTNRVGDFGFVLGMFLLFWALGGSWVQKKNVVPKHERVWSQVDKNYKPAAQTGTFYERDPALSPENSHGGVRMGPSLTFREIRDQLSSEESGMKERLLGMNFFGIPLLILAGILLFVGATAKSAQIPLYVWLPDAMAGPTPVSALIHAATMVTAGVYMVARLNFLFALSPAVMTVIAMTGAITAMFAATIGFVQNDIKKVLAYSTVSQLGFMFIGGGVGAYWAGVYHLLTHAFFKACLFLGSGSVILGCHHEQDMRRMGGLKQYTPITRWTYLAACCAIAGFPFAAGFYSKDEILWKAWTAEGLATPWMGHAIYLVGAVAALGTSFYMFRSYYMTFTGEYRGGHGHAPKETAEDPEAVAAHVHAAAALKAKDHHEAEVQAMAASLPHPHGHDAHAAEAHEHGGLPHESPRSMTWVLIALAFAAVVSGVIFGLPQLWSGHEPLLERFLSPSLPAAENVPFRETSHATEWLFQAIGVGIAGFGWITARALYLDARSTVPERLKAVFPRTWALVYNKYYVDELYQATVVRFSLWLSRALYWFDQNVIDGIVNAVATVGRTIAYVDAAFDQKVVDGAVNLLPDGYLHGGAKLRRLQTGRIQAYLFGALAGAIAFVIIQYVIR